VHELAAGAAASACQSMFSPAGAGESRAKASDQLEQSFDSTIRSLRSASEPLPNFDLDPGKCVAAYRAQMIGNWATNNSSRAPQAKPSGKKKPALAEQRGYSMPYVHERAMRLHVGREGASRGSSIRAPSDLPYLILPVAGETA